MTSINMYLHKIKSDFDIIFFETVEKYIFLKISPYDLHVFLKQRHFHSSNEYYFVKGILLWLQYDLDNRFDNALSLFSLINCRLCNKNIMLDNKLINTGNCKLDQIIQQLHINISVLNDKSTLELLNYYKLKSINSFSIPPYEESTINTKKQLSLYKLASDGIYDINIFIETIEKYNILKLSPNDLHVFLKQRHFHSSNEYYFVKGILLWLQFDLDNRFDNALSLFSLINCRLCNKNIMLDNKLINTGNCKLDLIIQQLHINMSVLNDKSTLKLLNYYKLNSINSFSIPSNEQSIINNKTMLSLYKVENDGIYDISSKHRIFQINLNKYVYIYINSYLLFINFTEGIMLRFNTITNDATRCSYPHDYLFNPNLFGPTVNVTVGGDLITIGGFSNHGFECRKVNIYNINTDAWSEGKSLPCGLDEHATVVVGEDIYVIGGTTDDGPTDNVIYYRDGKWNAMAPLLYCRSNHAALVRDNCIYVYGGFDWNEFHKPECFNITKNVWTS